MTTDRFSTDFSAIVEVVVNDINDVQTSAATQQVSTQAMTIRNAILRCRDFDASQTSSQTALVEQSVSLAEPNDARRAQMAERIRASLIASTTAQLDRLRQQADQIVQDQMARADVDSKIVDIKAKIGQVIQVNNVSKIIADAFTSVKTGQSMTLESVKIESRQGKCDVQQSTYIYSTARIIVDQIEKQVSDAIQGDLDDIRDMTDPCGVDRRVGLGLVATRKTTASGRAWNSSLILILILISTLVLILIVSFHKK